MKKLKALLCAVSLWHQKIFFTFFLFFVFSTFIDAQDKNPNAKQWETAGGQVVASGVYPFKQSDPANGILQGTFTVRGPGYVGRIFRRLKSVSPGVHLRELNKKRVFIVRSLGSQDLLKGADGNWKWYPPTMNTVNYTPNANLGGWVSAPTADKPTTTFEVWVTIEGGGRENDERAIEYEYWYFPLEGGKVISSTISGKSSTAGQEKPNDEIPDFKGDNMGRVDSGNLYDKTAGKKLEPGDTIIPGHEIYAGKIGKATFTTFSKNDKGEVQTSFHQLQSGTVFKIKKDVKKNQFSLSLIMGRLFNVINGPRSNNGFKIEIFNSVAAVEGTTFETSFDENTGISTVTVYDGLVSFSCVNSQMPPLMVSAGITATFDENCIPGLNATHLSLNTPAKAGWSTYKPSIIGGGLYPSADSHVYAYSYSNWNKANWGKYNVLGAGWNPTGGEKRAYLKFDISGINANSFEKATLKLYHNHTGGGNSADIGVYTVRSEWNEGNGNYKPSNIASPGEVCWVNQPQSDPYPVAYFNPGTQTNDFVEVDITVLVKSWLDGMPNYGLAIKTGESYLNGPESVYGFYSREHEDLDKRPQLIINGNVAANGSGTNTSWDAPKIVNASTSFKAVAGQWTADQNNGYKGTFNLQQNQSGRITGNAIWNGYLKGTISGTTSGNAIELTISYPNGDKGLYKGTLTQNGLKIVGGTVEGNNGVSAKWTAVKNVTSNVQNNSMPNQNYSSIIGQWEWFANGTVTFYPDKTVKGSNGSSGVWSQIYEGGQTIYTIKWSHGNYVDKLTLNGNTLDGKNQNGTRVWGKRIN